MKYNFDYLENDYKTPPVLYNKALKRFQRKWFNLDACCTDLNIPSNFYAKKDGLYALNMKIRDEDGLKTDWLNYTWCNPPFNECRKWIEKAYNENLKGRKIAMLLPVRTETKYWHEFILHNPNVTIEWLRKGYKFLDKDNKEMGVFKNALALVYFE